MATATAPFVTWNDSLTIGVQEIDAQHKNLVSVLNQLHLAMSQGHGKDVMGTTLNSLVSYTRAHFAAEERIMRQNGYPDIAAHKKEHEALTEKVLTFQHDFDAGRVGMGVDVMQFLGTWLKEHIRGSDRKYVPFLHAHGVR